AGQREALARAVEREQAAVGDQPDRTASAVDIPLVPAVRRDERNLGRQRAARMFDAEENDLRYDVVEIARAERARKADIRLVVAAAAEQIDVAFAVHLDTGQDPHIDSAL